MLYFGAFDYAMFEKQKYVVNYSMKKTLWQ